MLQIGLVRMIHRLRPLPRLALLSLLLVLAPAYGGLAQTQTVPAQPEMETGTLTLVTANGEFEFTVEIADEPREHSRGLMFRETMDVRHGMWFDFGETRPVTMWMKNTPMSLDMVFVRPDGTVARVAERTEPFSEAIITSGEPVSHVLELRAGVARMIGLKPGDRLLPPVPGR